MAAALVDRFHTASRWPWWMLDAVKTRQHATPPQRADELADVVLPDHETRAVRLGDLWRDGPAVIVWLRQFGCPFCRAYAVQLELSPRAVRRRGRVAGPDRSGDAARCSVLPAAAAHRPAGARRQGPRQLPRIRHEAGHPRRVDRSRGRREGRRRYGPSARHPRPQYRGRSPARRHLGRRLGRSGSVGTSLRRRQRHGANGRDPGGSTGDHLACPTRCRAGDGSPGRLEKPSMTLRTPSRVGGGR